jgi:hypothetical protein
VSPHELGNRFTFHPARAEQAGRYQVIRQEALRFAERLNELAPDSREFSLAITHIEEAVFWANAAIARHT